MPSKKKRGRRPAATKRAKAKTGAKKTRAKSKVAAVKARPKAKAGPRKAKRPPARKRPPATVAKAKSPQTVTRPTGPLVIDEVLEESLLDVSTILRVKDGVARSQRDVDEDELKQFPDPSLVIEVVTTEPQRDEDTTDDSLSDLFAAEARRQKQRDAESQADGESHRRDGSLFGSLGSAAPKKVDGEDPSDDHDDD